MARIDSFIINSRITKGVSDYVVIYDITENKERSKVDKLLKGYGFRIQKSVFECRLNRRLKAELTDRIEKLNLQTGFIKIYRMEYHSQKMVFGEKAIPSKDEQGAVFIV